jgi:hypothetical protein
VALGYSLVIIVQFTQRTELLSLATHPIIAECAKLTSNASTIAIPPFCRMRLNRSQIFEGGSGGIKTIALHKTNVDVGITDLASPRGFHGLAVRALLASPRSGT